MLNSSVQKGVMMDCRNGVPFEEVPLEVLREKSQDVTQTALC